MTWPAYTEYKESDVEWIGAIPSDWSVRPLRYICDVQTGDRDTVHRVDDGEYPFFIRSENVQRIDTWSMDGEAVLTPGDGAVGQVFHYYVGKFDYHQRVYAFFNFRAVSGRYFYYYLSALFAKVALDGSAKTTVDSLRMPLIKGFMIAHPGPLAQEQIVRFLDRETAKIDALIDKQEQLIATLREDRAATITHAVTKGLDPDTETVHSGSNWLGPIPIHWPKTRLRNIISIIESGTSVNCSDVLASPDEAGVLKTSCVSSGKFDPTQHKTAFPEEAQRVSCPVTAETIIVNRANTPDLVGSAGYVKNDVPGIYLSDLLWSVTVAGARPDFVHGWMQGAVYRTQVAAWRTGTSASMQKLSKSSLRSFEIALPPFHEQGEIVEFLASRRAGIDALIDKSIEMIETLREYRSALITNAVTGKIDVREAV